MLTTDPEESLLGDLHVRGGRRSCRRPTRGSHMVASDVLPSHIGSSLVALGRVNRRKGSHEALSSGPTFRMKH